MYRWAVLIAFALVQLFCAVECKSSEDPMVKAAGMMRTVCMGKTKASLNDVEGLVRGEFADNKEIMCYANCVLEMMQAMKKGKINTEAAIKQIEMMSSEIAVPMVNAFNMCKNAADGMTNNCEAAYALVKCLHKNNPNFFFA